ncbi:unnamed protein product [Rotaria socialis]
MSASNDFMYLTRISLAEENIIHEFWIEDTQYSNYAFDAGFKELGTCRLKDKDTTHYGITVCGLCHVTIDYFKLAYKIDLTHLDGKFSRTNGQCDKSIVKDITNSLKKFLNKTLNSWEYPQTVKIIAASNTKTDLKEMLKEKSHFDSETFVGGSKLILKRYQITVDSIMKDDHYDQARKTFGEL